MILLLLFFGPILVASYSFFDFSKLDFNDFFIKNQPRETIFGTQKFIFPPEDATGPPFGVKRIQKVVDEEKEDKNAKVTLMPEIEFTPKLNNKPVKPQKKKKEVVEIVTPPFEYEPNLQQPEIIERAIDALKINDDPKRYQMRKLMESFASDDLVEYENCSNDFKDVFKVYPHSFKFNEVPSYLFRYAIMFGAEKILEKKWNRQTVQAPKTKQFNLIPAFDYLIAHKPLSKVVNILSLKWSPEFDKDLIRHIETKIKQLHPNLSYFYSIFFKLIGCDDARNFRKFLQIEDIRQGMEDLARTLEYKSGHLYLRRPIVIADIALQNPQIYQSLSKDFKFTFLHLMVISNDPQKLEQLINLDPEITTFNFNGKFNIMHLALSTGVFGFQNTSRMIIEKYPELIISKPPLGSVPIELCSASLALQFLDQFKLDLFSKFDHEGKKMNLIQIAFANGDYHNFISFADIVGKDRAIQMINEIWDTRDKIMASIFKLTNSYYGIREITQFFNLDLNAQYTHNNLRGNAMIFSKVNTLLIPSMLETQLNIDCSAPVTITNPTTGESRIVYDWIHGMPEN